MKLSKSLLKAIVVGVTISSTTSCGLVKQNSEIEHEHLETCPENCDITHHTDERNVYDNCPGCGMG